MKKQKKLLSKINYETLQKNFQTLYKSVLRTHNPEFLSIFQSIVYYFISINSTNYNQDFFQNDLLTTAKPYFPFLVNQLSERATKLFWHSDKSPNLQPNNPYTFYAYGVNFYSQKKYSEAIDLFNKALTINPEYLPAYNLRSKSYEFLNDIDKSKADLKKIEEIKADFKKYPVKIIKNTELKI